MAKLCISNIALSPFDHEEELRRLPGLGLEALEVAPSRVWRDTFSKLKAPQVLAYRKQIEDAGLQAAGLHSLFFDHPELGLFRDPETRARTLDFLVHLSGVCRDLGGRTLIWGGGRQRGRVSEADAYSEAGEFMAELCHRVGDHGTCFCFEPLGPEDTDFIHSGFDALKLVNGVNHPAFRVQLDAKALIANDEAVADTFTGMGDRLVHFHANEPDLGVLGTSGTVDHAELGRLLKGIDYKGYVSIEQRLLNEQAPLADVAESARVLRTCYF